MAMHKDVESALNKQLELEFDAQIVYLGMFIHFEKELFKGFAAWFKKQVAEEQGHALKIIQYMLDRNAQPIVPPVAAPKVTYSTALEALRAALAHERANTAGIHHCLGVANKSNDPATAEMLQWFVKEQVEEERWAEEYVTMVERIEKSIGGMYQFDHRVGKAAKGE